MNNLAKKLVVARGDVCGSGWWVCVVFVCEHERQPDTYLKIL